LNGGWMARRKWNRRRVNCPVCGAKLDWNWKLVRHAEMHARAMGCTLIDKAFTVWLLPDGRKVAGNGYTLLTALAGLK